jgi:sugar phosphate isomerase/epimerase
MTNFPFGVSLIFFGEQFDEPLARELVTAGVETFEINARHLALADQRDTARQNLARFRPRASSMHALFGPEYDFSRLEPEQWRYAVDRAVEAVEIAAELDIPILVIHASAEPVLPEVRARRLEQAIQGLSLIGEKAHSTGRRIAIEYLPRTCLGNSLAELNLLVDRLGEESFGVCLDVNHLMAQYTQLPQVTRALGQRLIATHISDCDQVDEKHWLPGRGVLDWPGFMQALREIDYQGPFTYECDVAGGNLTEKLTSLQENYHWLVNL